MMPVLQALTVVLAVTLAMGCGAPTKSASDVKSLFARDATSLEEKVTKLCKTLKARDTKPNFEDADLPVDDCKDAGHAAANLRGLQKFSFVGLEDINDKDKDDVIRRFVRTELWLNYSLIGMAGAIAQRMKETQQAGDNKGLISLPNSEGTSGFSDLAAPDIEIIEEPEFNLGAFSFSTAIRLQVTGAVTVDNTIRVNGGLIDNKLAVVIHTDGKQPIEKSLIRDFSALVLIVPHASDIYLDLFVNLNIHNVGFKGLFEERITDFLGSGLKGIIDGFFTL